MQKLDLHSAVELVPSPREDHVFRVHGSPRKRSKWRLMPQSRTRRHTASVVSPAGCVAIHGSHWVL